MPELPDLQVFSSNLTKKLKGKVLKKVVVVNKNKLNVTEDELKKSLEKQELDEVVRVGKELHFKFNNGNVLGLHLMLNGELYLSENENTRKHTIIELWFDNDSVLALTDYQSAATPTLNPKEKDAPDALDKEVNTAFLKEKLQKRTTIKNFLLDQKNIRGIGNAYADEILWDAGISPLSVCNKIPDDKIKALAHSIKTILKHAESQIRKADPDIITGEVRDFLLIHNSTKKESPNGAAIKTTMVNSRKTYYTEEQELYT